MKILIIVLRVCVWTTEMVSSIGEKRKVDRGRDWEPSLEYDTSTWNRKEVEVGSQVQREESQRNWIQFLRWSWPWLRCEGENGEGEEEESSFKFLKILNYFLMLTNQTSIFIDFFSFFLIKMKRKLS